MNCRTAQRQMALAVGEDLPSTEIQELQRHLQDCSKCQQTWEQHQRGFAVLQHSRTQETHSKRNSSVWPTVVNRLHERGSVSPRGDFNGWIAALAVMTACVLLIVFSQDDSIATATRSQRGSLVGGTMVSAPSNLPETAAPLLREDDVRAKRPYKAGPPHVQDRP